MLSTTRDGKPPRLSPTDVSQFIRLEQCERYLRLRLHERAWGSQFLRDANATPQAIPPLLTRSGATFEATVMAAVAQAYEAIDFASVSEPGVRRQSDSGAVVERIRALGAGEVVVLFQPRLQVEVEGWALTGDADVIRIERAGNGQLHLLIVDMKSTVTVKVEHRLQVAFYHAMLAGLLDQAGEAYASIQTAILYRGETGATGKEMEAQRRAALRWLAVEDAYLELIEDGESYLETVRDLVTSPDSLSNRVGRMPFEEVPYHLAIRCDGCLYNEFCMRWSAERDDLTLLPHLTAAEKAALLRAGVKTVRELATLKDLETEAGSPRLVPAAGQEALCRSLAVTWPVGPRLDELVLRARRYRRWKGDDLAALSYIPSKGYTSLPAVDATLNANMVFVYLDAQHDYLEDRLYLVGAQVVAAEGGYPARQRHVVHMTEGPPRSPEDEQALLLGWLQTLLRTLVAIASPDEAREPRAPVHLVFYNRYAMKVLLNGLSRHFGTILSAAPALYDFMTQLAAFDSPVATFLEEELRELKNYPMVCQSLQSTARYLRFDWDEQAPFTEVFKERLFDYLGKLETENGGEWFTRRSRFNSQVPLEYAYAAWGDLDAPTDGRQDPYAPYRRATTELLQRFQARRLEAMRWIANDLGGNKLSRKTAYHLPDLAEFSDVARSMAQALDEFVTIERHVELEAWKGVRHAPPERRVLMGEALIVRYFEADQSPEVAAANRDHERRRLLKEAFRAETPGARMTREQKAELDWSQDGLPVRLRLERDGLDCDLEAALALSTIREGDTLIVSPRWTVDERLPEHERSPFTPTPKQLLYASRLQLDRLSVERDAAGRVIRAFADATLKSAHGGSQTRGFAFGSMDRPLIEGGVYTLDPCPNNWYGYWCAKVCEGLRGLEAGRVSGQNAIYHRIARPTPARVTWPAAAEAGQARFMAGLDALHRAGAMHDFEPSKRAYIAQHGQDPILLVQGPPGTGKSYSTAFAVFARMQGAMAAAMPFRAFVSCKTHAATDVLIQDIAEVQHRLRAIQREHPALFAQHFDDRLLLAPLYRLHPRETPTDRIQAIDKDETPAQKHRTLQAAPWCVVATTPGGVYSLVTKRWPNQMFDHALCDCLILDEASQMNLPEAVMAGLLLKADGQFIVVGDHRQMPPIIKHDWDAEPRRTFQEYRAYESLFTTLLPLEPPIVKFEESFRLHTDMAEFLRREIYAQDGIRYHSRRRPSLPVKDLPDPFVAAVLAPEHPLIVVLHDEDQSQTSNTFEQALLSPIIEALTAPELFGLDAREGLGIVVPHRAQRAALQLAFPRLGVLDAAGDRVMRWAVDTVERFQGGERSVILISATESDYEYLLVAGDFLLDPRRLTVALSRAKAKLVLVASKSVFSLFSPNEETFKNAQLWKHLLRRTCTRRLWEGTRDGHTVQVWGNQAIPMKGGDS